MPLSLFFSLALSLFSDYAPFCASVDAEGTASSIPFKNVLGPGIITFRGMARAWHRNASPSILLILLTQEKAGVKTREELPAGPITASQPQLNRTVQLLEAQAIASPDVGLPTLTSVSEKQYDAMRPDMDLISSETRKSSTKVMKPFQARCLYVHGCRARLNAPGIRQLFSPSSVLTENVYTRLADSEVCHSSGNDNVAFLRGVEGDNKKTVWNVGLDNILSDQPSCVTHPLNKQRGMYKMWNLRPWPVTAPSSSHLYGSYMCLDLRAAIFGSPPRFLYGRRLQAKGRRLKRQQPSLDDTSPCPGFIYALISTLDGLPPLVWAFILPRKEDFDSKTRALLRSTNIIEAKLNKASHPAFSRDEGLILMSGGPIRSGSSPVFRPLPLVCNVIWVVALTKGVSVMISVTLQALSSLNVAPLTGSILHTILITPSFRHNRQHYLVLIRAINTSPNCTSKHVLSNLSTGGESNNHIKVIEFWVGPPFHPNIQAVRTMASFTWMATTQGSSNISIYNFFLNVCTPFFICASRSSANSIQYLMAAYGLGYALRLGEREAYVYSLIVSVKILAPPQTVIYSRCPERPRLGVSGGQRLKNLQDFVLHTLSVNKRWDKTKFYCLHSHYISVYLDQLQWDVATYTLWRHLWELQSRVFYSRNLWYQTVWSG
ncbi:uncharacterized protein CLUP02_07564 [Colletotrichum lupini]|uniref:Uncharacterized protein n=1 Tax=Colletotrichum lupini TaxID=145971 RepID=A0A9Q8SRF4_9PEZI|nr:uncharacterized protein CLUP02_07564 [Colletotrichum lupini]UQC82078.1 hypothetical protein CLUP02_07564 [Colletotrichum lupini]